MKLLMSSPIFILVLTATLVPCSETFHVQSNVGFIVGRRTPGSISSSWSTATTASTQSSSSPQRNNVLVSPLFGSESHHPRDDSAADHDKKGHQKRAAPAPSFLIKSVWSSMSVLFLVLYRLWLRMDNVIDLAPGLDRSTVMTAGIGSSVSGLVQKVKTLPQDIRNLTWKDVKPIKRIKGLHGPITYLVLAVVAANRYKWMWRNPAWWFGVAFCIKWFRARYIFKIPVWDRQPNWNNVITSKEQEKDLKAFTCKTCGSTIFIAKTREFFFEGATGIGGLGCFNCGAKGADNFVMDRDRIVEDVADEDDYFEYERPLDFISRAERRALMREAGGDEDKANQILVDRTNAQASVESQAIAEGIVNGGGATIDAAPPAAAGADTGTTEGEVMDDGPSDDDSDRIVAAEEETDDSGVGDDDDDNDKDATPPPPLDSMSTSHVETKSPKKVTEKTTVPSPEKTTKPPPPPVPMSSKAADEDDLDAFDALGMDDF
jgi:hypothetical protein